MKQLDVHVILHITEYKHIRCFLLRRQSHTTVGSGVRIGEAQLLRPWKFVLGMWSKFCRSAVCQHSCTPLHAP